MSAFRKRRPYCARSVPAAVHLRHIDTFSQRVSFAIIEFTDSTMLVEASGLRCAYGNVRQVNVNISGTPLWTDLAVPGQMPSYSVVRLSRNR